MRVKAVTRGVDDTDGPHPAMSRAAIGRHTARAEQGAETRR